MIITTGARRHFRRVAALATVAFIGLGAAAVRADSDAWRHGFATYGALKYPADFSHFDYVNPAAPKGGKVTIGTSGTFNSLNPFIMKGVPAALVGLTYDTLLRPSGDEDFSSYGRLVESLKVAADRSGMRIKLRAEARWHDGKPITAADVVWTFETLTTEGAPIYRYYYKDVTKAEVVGPREVAFSFSPTGSLELPSIVGQLPVLPKHYWQGRDFAKTTLEPPLGSGPYRIGDFEPGRFIELERVADYWGRDIPVNKGRYNFGALRAEYYRDGAVLLEAFKAGKIDYRRENSARRWATGYDFPAVDKGLVKVKAFPHSRPAGMQGFVFNLRRPQFQDPRVREALGHSFDFEWANKTLFYGQYQRITSYFMGKDWAARGLPTGAELKILEQFRGQIPDAVFTEEFKPPVTDGSGRNRRGLRKALKLLKEAGWTVRDGVLKNAAGEEMRFEILLQSGSTMDKVALPVVETLKRLGVTATLRQVDTAQYQNRYRDFDFDMVVGSFGPVLPPGSEQHDYWHSETADTKGSSNLTGVKDPVLDALTDGVIAAKNYDQLVAWSRALDRVLLWSHLLIPQFTNQVDRLAYWDRFARPKVANPSGVSVLGDWWLDPAGDARVRAARDR